MKKKLIVPTTKYFEHSPAFEDSKDSYCVEDVIKEPDMPVPFRLVAK